MKILTLKSTLTIALLLCIPMLASSDASVDLGHGKTRFDLAAAWCAQFDNDPRLTFYILDGDRVVFARSCAAQ